MIKSKTIYYIGTMEFSNEKDAKDYEKQINVPLLKLVCNKLGYGNDPYCEISSPEPNAIEIKDFIINNKKQIIELLSK
jgi:hypothetical protein